MGCLFSKIKGSKVLINTDEEDNLTELSNNFIFEQLLNKTGVNGLVNQMNCQIHKIKWNKEFIKDDQIQIEELQLIGNDKKFEQKNVIWFQNFIPDVKESGEILIIFGSNQSQQNNNNFGSKNEEKIIRCNNQNMYIISNLINQLKPQYDNEFILFFENQDIKNSFFLIKNENPIVMLWISEITSVEICEKISRIPMSKPKKQIMNMNVLKQHKLGFMSSSSPTDFYVCICDDKNSQWMNTKKFMFFFKKK